MRARRTQPLAQRLSSGTANIAIRGGRSVWSSTSHTTAWSPNGTRTELDQLVVRAAGPGAHAATSGDHRGYAGPGDLFRWYNTTPLAGLVGTSGQVTIVDIDEDITDRASRLLGEVGYTRVKVVLADAEFGVRSRPVRLDPVTVGAGDVPSAWVARLAGGGRLVVPLQVKGLARTIAFEQADGCLISRSSGLFGFVPTRAPERIRTARRTPS